jgi:hypothetical protein
VRQDQEVSISDCSALLIVAQVASLARALIWGPKKITTLISLIILASFCEIYNHCMPFRRMRESRVFGKRAPRSYRSIASSFLVCWDKINASSCGSATFVLAFGSFDALHSRRSRARRMRCKSICASATRRASSWISAAASGPAISRASTSTSSDKAGSEWMGRLSPWRSALRAERAREFAVFGPVLARALARFAAILRALVTTRCSGRWILRRWFDSRHPLIVGPLGAIFAQALRVTLAPEWILCQRRSRVSDRVAHMTSRKRSSTPRYGMAAMAMARTVWQATWFNRLIGLAQQRWQAEVAVRPKPPEKGVFQTIEEIDARMRELGMDVEAIDRILSSPDRFYGLGRAQTPLGED